MKYIKFLAIFFFAFSVKAQVSINVNIGTPPPVVVETPKVVIAPPPVWGPIGYDNVEYYYLPDIQVYYDIRLAQFIYFGGSKWIRAKHLPSRYRNYDLYRGYKVVLTDYHGRTPYTHFHTHKVKYYKGYKKPQKCRSEVAYYNNRSHNDHNHKHDRDNDHDKHHNRKHKDRD